jgi:protein-S-isoprenylcysteine O-methyltransferase Ste14
MEFAMTPHAALLGLWVAWMLSWLAAALWSNRTENRAGFMAELGYRVPTLIGAVLLFYEFDDGFEAATRLWSVGEMAGWLLVLLALAGFAFTWWARLHLGRLWSGTITRKAGHKIIDSGPYALVRHPIYTGLFLAVIATAVDRGTLLALVGAVVLMGATYIKARTEENFLKQELGSEAYEAYRRRVPMLVPFLPKAD